MDLALTYSPRQLSTPDTAEIYFAEIPSATMRMEKNSKMMMKTRKLMREPQRKIHMLILRLRVRSYVPWLSNSLTDRSD